MSAADEVVTQRVASRGLLRRFGRPRSWQLFALPHFVVGYVFLIIAADLGLTGWGIAVTPVRAADAALFAALLACGAVFIEATPRLGQPPGGFPPQLQERVLKGRPASTERPGKNLAPTDIPAARQKASALLGRPATEFGLYFILLPIGFLTGSAIASRVGSGGRTELMVLIGSLLCLAAAAVQAVLLLSLPPAPLLFFLPGAAITLSQGISLPYAQAGAMAMVPRLAGTAAGIGFFVQQFCGAGS